jgi:hypothetical protein
MKPQRALTRPGPTPFGDGASHGAATPQPHGPPATVVRGRRSRGFDT